MKKLSDIFREKKQTFSFELFPPKTEQGYEKLLFTIGELAKLKPDFISVTYGAGGGNRDKTFDIVEHIEKKYLTAGVAHLTCVLHTKDEIKTIIGDIKRRGIQNILALRGDPPSENPHWQPEKNNFKYSSELCGFIRKSFGDYFSVGVAGFPEGHILCPDREKDAGYLKMKVEAGADYVITQLFFDNEDYFEYVKRLRKRKVDIRIIPGIIPITDYNNIVRFCERCGAGVPQRVHDIFAPIQNDREKTLQEGIRFCVNQCRDLLQRGAPGLHFYTLNKAHPVDVILQEIRK